MRKRKITDSGHKGNSASKQGPIDQSQYMTKCTFYSHPVSRKTIQSSHLTLQCAQETLIIKITRVRDYGRNPVHELRLCPNFGGNRFWPNFH